VDAAQLLSKHHNIPEIPLSAAAIKPCHPASSDFEDGISILPTKSRAGYFERIGDLALKDVSKRTEGFSPRRRRD
jgi:hypothetical protein